MNLIPTPAQFLQFAQWAGILTLVCGAIAALAFLLQWGFRFRLVGATGFMIVLTIGLFGLGLVPFTRETVPGAINASTVFDNGSTQVVIAVPPTITAEQLTATLQQAAQNRFSPGRLSVGRENRLTIRARTLLHPAPGITQPLVLGQVKRSLLERNDTGMELTIFEENLAKLPQGKEEG